MTCESGNRCTRCRKIQYKLRVKQYQEARRSMMEDSDRDAMGNLLVHPSRIESLMRDRVRIGRAYRRWKRVKCPSPTTTASD